MKPAAVSALVLAFSLFSQGAESSALPTLTTIRQIRALTPSKAQQGYPVRLRAVVTFYNVAAQGPNGMQLGAIGSNMFIQDSTGGNWVGAAVGQQPLKAGDLIEIEGKTSQTDFAPDIAQPQWRVIGSAPLPPAVRSEFGRLASTKLDSMRVEIEGIVRSAQRVDSDLRLEIAMDSGRVIGYIPDFNQPIPATLVDSAVRIRGVCGAEFNEKNQVRGVKIFIPSLSDIQVLDPGLADPFAIPLESINSILRFQVVGTAGHRVRIHGVVTLQRLGQYAYIKGDSGSTRVESSQPVSLKVGDTVDAVGFPAMGEYAPVLEQSVFRVVGHGATPIPISVQANELLDGRQEGDLVQLDAELLDRALTPGEQILIAESGGAVIQGELEDPNAIEALRSFERGSRLRLQGICKTGTNHGGRPGEIRLLLRSPSDIQVLSRPSWLTFQHALWIVASLMTIILAIVTWLTVLRRKVRQQTRLIRDRLEREATLEHRYRQLFERNLAGVYRMALDGRLLDCNDACAQMLGYAGRNQLLPLEAGDGHTSFPAIAALVGRSTNRTRSELCLQRRDGREMWALVNATLLEDGEESVIEGTIIEITELKQTVKMLEERTTQLSALLENNPLAIGVMDPEGRFVMCNPAFERLFLFEAAEVIGRPIEKTILPPQLLHEAEEHINRLQSGQTIFRPTRRMRKDSTLVDVEAYGVPLIIEGRVCGFFGIYLDIRERLAAEAELRRMKDAAEAANRAKSAFLANISHEIRTPLSGVLMAANLAISENVNSVLREYLDIIVSCGKSLQLLLNDVLDLSKIEAGKMELRVSGFSISECLTDSVRLLESTARQKGLDLNLKVADNVPDFVSGDALRLRQIVINLVGNAIKFTDRGSITLSARCAGRNSEPFYIEFSVEDTGIGIPPEKHSAVFREFEQAEDTTSRIFGGTGLGLAISNKLARLMGGKMWLESTVGQGSVFYFTVAFGPAERTPITGKQKIGRQRVNILHFLIAEDNAVNRRLAVRQLEKLGHIVVAVADGKQAVQISSERAFDVILMDVHMPEMDGIEATRRIRRRELVTGMHVPIIALTAGAMKQDRDACLEAGMDAYVSKPINPDELLATVAAVIPPAPTESVAS